MDLMTLHIGNSGIIMKLFAYIFVLLYILVAAIFVYFYSNEVFLKRVQTGVWAQHEHSEYSEPIGESYRTRNPVYKKF